MIESYSESIVASINQARKLSIDGEYQTAIELYNNIEHEIAIYLFNIRNIHNNIEASQICDLEAIWNKTLTDITEEKNCTLDIINELGSIFGETFKKEHISNADKTSVKPLTKEFESHQNIEVGVNVGKRNEINYGDKDRFGPVKPQLNKTKWKLNKEVIQPVNKVKTTLKTLNRTKVKPSVPQINKSTIQSSKTDLLDKTPNINSLQKEYQARPGEEDLVELIKANIVKSVDAVVWNDIVGNEEVKQLLQEAIVYPILMPDYFTGIRRPWRGVLLYGAPGTGKTLLAKAVASECNSTFFNISPATLVSKWRGDSEKLVRILFEMARFYAPSTIFIDEIDALCSQRDNAEHEASRRAKSTLLAEMDGVGTDSGKIVMVLGATNYPWDIDEAMRRRLEKRIYIPLPNKKNIHGIIQLNTKKLKISTNIRIEEIVDKMAKHNYSCADIANIIREASMKPMRRCLSTYKNISVAELSKLASNDPITHEDFIESIEKIVSSINVDQLHKLKNWELDFVKT